MCLEPAGLYELTVPVFRANHRQTLCMRLEANGRTTIARRSIGCLLMVTARQQLEFLTIRWQMSNGYTHRPLSRRRSPPLDGCKRAGRDVNQVDGTVPCVSWDSTAHGMPRRLSSAWCCGIGRRRTTWIAALRNSWPCIAR
jgi:hypothetical protein